MKLIIKSKQNYGTHIEEYSEEFQCSVVKIDDVLKINFDNGSILIEENKLTYERNENKIVIEPDKTNECDYETEHGMFVLDIKGLEVETMKSIQEETLLGTIAKAKYQILITGVEPYINEIEIIISE